MLIETRVKLFKTNKLKLKNDELNFLLIFTKTGDRNCKEFERACILLALHKGKKLSEIEDFYNVNRITIWRLKRKYETHGLQKAIKNESLQCQLMKYTVEQKAEIVAIACTKAPEGQERWTLKLLEEKLKKREGMETINRENIRLTLKKMHVSLGV